MYKYVLTVKDMLQLKSGRAMQEVPDMPASDLRGAKEMKVTDLEVLQDYMSVEEREAL